MRGGVIRKKGRPGKGRSGGTGKRGQGCGRGGKMERPLQSSKSEKTWGPTGAGAARSTAVPAEIVQDAAGNLHPFGLHDEDPQQEQGIPAPRGRGPRVWHEERVAAAPTRTRRGKGETRSLTFCTLSPGPPRLGRGAGRSPGSYAPFCLNGPMGCWKIGSLSTLSQ